MRWSSEYDWGETTWKGRKNNIKFKIKEYSNGFNKTEIIGYYVLCELSKDSDIVLNTLWVRDKFKSLEEAQQWCEGLTKEELIRLREIGLKKNK